MNDILFLLTWFQSDSLQNTFIYTISFLLKRPFLPKRANVSYMSVILLLLYREFYNSSQCTVLKSSLETKLDVGGIVIVKNFFLKTIN